MKDCFIMITLLMLIGCNQGNDSKSNNQQPRHHIHDEGTDSDKDSENPSEENMHFSKKCDLTDISKCELSEKSKSKVQGYYRDSGMTDLELSLEATRKYCKITAEQAQCLIDNYCKEDFFK